MKALFEYNGFTRMDDNVPDDPPQRYDIPCMKPIDIYTLSTNTIDTSLSIWVFELHGIECVDSEMVAIYKYKGNR